MLSQLVLNGLTAGAVIALLAGGFQVMFASSRFFVFTFGTSYLYGAYGMLLCNRILPLALSATIGIAIAAAVSTVLEVLVYGRIRRRGSSSLVLMLASIGAYVVLQNVVSMTFGDATRSVRAWSATEGLSLLGARITPVQLLIVAVSSTAVLLVGIFLATSTLGGTLRAVAADTSLARAVGVQVNATRAWASGLGGAMAGLAGVLMSLDTDMTPTMGFRALLLAIVASIVGGIGSYAGAALGGVLVGLILHLSVWRLPAAWQEAILFVVLVAFLLLRPQGILRHAVHTAPACSTE